MIHFVKESCYSLYDLLTLRRGKKVYVNGFPFMFPVRYFKYFPADYERENFRFFHEQQKPGMTCIDIGAHFGLFSILMQKVSNGRVYSFEPTPYTVRILKKTLELNRVEEQVEVVPAAVAERSGKACFFIERTPGSVSNSLVGYETLTNAEPYEVDVISLDDFVQEKHLQIDFIKIDAEGAELAVLKGADRLLREQRPVMILAMHPPAIQSKGDSNKMIWDELQRQNYQVTFNGHLITEKEFIDQKELFDVHLLPGMSEITS